MKFNNISIFSFAVIFTLLLSTNANAGLFSKKKSPAPWANEPMLKSESCGDISYKDVAEFVIKYMPKEQDTSNVKKASKRLTTSYMVASIAVNQANLCLADALELKAVKEDLLAERELLKSGTSASKKEIKKQRQYAASASKKMQEAALKAKTLEPAQQQTFIIGASAYLLGTYNTYEIKEDGEKLLKVTEADLAKTKSKAKSGFSLGNITDAAGKGKDYIAAIDTMKKVLAGLPKHLPKLVTTAKFFIEYADQQNLTLDEDATEEFNASVSGMDW